MRKVKTQECVECGSDIRKEGSYLCEECFRKGLQKTI